ncbi:MULTISPECIES: fimbrial biogenesis outer membrane usher protein [unclassified Pseudomonas]|uniref:fimbria/pilus outer membrane usher protein n=1 Tax=unclassified Pseudomonas TaxID=196821 RepID=UPI00244AF096|nr:MULTISPECIES: fimbrial biogenesis outer membrane usher protein [unclassified Pseudomonas]MDH0303429.1 fimbrial biogenesis outer membrane usher protein [Pseudomonas sp. GD04091]MDH1984504.1 fimbrial biogenesis outer membrane usher protein [Pseudomonas sp. GD03689]
MSVMDLRLVLLGLLALPGVGLASPVEFDPRLLRLGTSADLQRFERADVVAEGELDLDVTLNQHWAGRHRISLRLAPGASSAVPCYASDVLQALGVDLQRLTPEARSLLEEANGCAALDALGMNASEALEYAELRLVLSISQDSLLRRPVDLVSPQSWDSGVTVGFVDYDLNLYQQQAPARGSIRQGFLGLRAGLNTGDWYWRHEGSLQDEGDASTRYRLGATSVRRDVPAWSAQLALGDAFTSADVFSGTAFRGVQLGSDERMLPQSRRGYAPTVRGIANSTALVSIRHRGRVVHESTVAPGPFEIDDLYPSGLSDDLEVTVREADGSVQVFTVPFQAAALALRSGGKRFDWGAGRWRDGYGRVGPAFSQGSWQQGLNNRVSVHGGLWMAQDYLGSAMGVALNAGVGAVGLTGYHASAAPSPGGTRQGQAVRLNWRQEVAASGSRLDASITRSQSPGYLGFDQFAQARHGRSEDSSHWRASVVLDQTLGARAGRLNLSVSGTRSWAGRGSTDYLMGYNNHFGALAYGVTLSRQRHERGDSFRTLTASFSVPLGERRRGVLSSATRFDARGASSGNLRWNARAGEHSQWGHGLAAVYQGGARDPVGIDGNLRYHGPAGDLSAALGIRGDQRQLALGARGALVAHAGGVTAAPTLGESFAIVHAPGATAARVRQHSQARLDRRGYAVVPSLVPYSVNTLEIDPKGMPRSTELLVAGHKVVPRAGAAPLLRFATRHGSLQVFRAEHQGGEALPFGARVFDEQGSEIGIVGQGNLVQVRTGATRGRLRVSWGDAPHQACWLDFEVDQEARATSSCMPA